MHGAYKNHVLPGPCDSDIQPALSACPVQRSEIVIKLTALILAVGSAENDRIALITLHSFKILNEKGFFTVATEKCLKRRIFPAPHCEHTVDYILLRY